MIVFSKYMALDFRVMFVRMSAMVYPVLLSTWTFYGWGCTAGVTIGS